MAITATVTVITVSLMMYVRCIHKNRTKQCGHRNQKNTKTVKTVKMLKQKNQRIFLKRHWLMNELFVQLK